MCQEYNVFFSLKMICCPLVIDYINQVAFPKDKMYSVNFLRSSNLQDRGDKIAISNWKRFFISTIARKIPLDRRHRIADVNYKLLVNRSACPKQGFGGILSFRYIAISFRFQGHKYIPSNRLDHLSNSHKFLLR